MLALVDMLRLNNVQLDAIKEVGNIGAGNAATALSKLIKTRVEMSVPDIKILPFSRITATIGGPDAHVTAIYYTIKGQAPGTLLFLIPIIDARKITDVLLNKDIGHDQLSFDEMERSALTELGNILAGSFLNALNMFTSIHFVPTVPALCIDMVGAILGSVLTNLGMVSDYVLFIKTDFKYLGNHALGNLYFLPEAEALQVILESLGVNN
ncbi:MAG: chemotaxis protein CheC [Thermacetogeniaceae bacterium]|nr:chemotaxis protein CheC [Thermoanaerobacterales bacterium]NLN20669.1 chemotaxis protein CheC [Syntrophomonadaceae bacterium]